MDWCTRSPGFKNFFVTTIQFGNVFEFCYSCLGQSPDDTSLVQWVVGEVVSRTGFRLTDNTDGLSGWALPVGGMAYQIWRAWLVSAWCVPLENEKYF